MADYIDRQELIDFVKRNDLPHSKNEFLRGYIIGLIVDAPSADVQKVVHGRWIKNAPNRKQLQKIKDMGFAKGMGIDSIFYTCSNCNMWGAPHMQYCSHCGAKMCGDSE